MTPSIRSMGPAIYAYIRMVLGGANGRHMAVPFVASGSPSNYSFRKSGVMNLQTSGDQVGWLLVGQKEGTEVLTAGSLPNQRRVPRQCHTDLFFPSLAMFACFSMYSGLMSLRKPNKARPGHQGRSGQHMMFTRSPEFRNV